jgi:ribosomal protein L37AE/L43A
MSTTTRTPGMAADLPVPDRTTRIGRPTAEMEAKLNRTFGIMAAVFAIAGAVAYWSGHSIWAYILGGLGVVLFISIFTKKTDVGQCPYCLENFTATVESGLWRCEKCGEYSQIANKIVKPMDPATYSESPKFESVLFKQGSMPNACAACGAPASRLDTATSSTMNKTLAVAGAARLMTGTPGLAIFSSKQASITVPYCDQHRNGVTIGFDWRKKPILTWSSLRMMRRYLHVNRGKEKY